MPLITISNTPRDDQHIGSGLRVWEHSFASSMVEAVLRCNVPDIGIAPWKVTVVFGGCQVLGMSRTLFVIVDPIFDRPDRTRPLLETLAFNLHRCAQGFVPEGWKVEVGIRRFDTGTDVYLVDGVLVPGNDRP